MLPLTHVQWESWSEAWSLAWISVAMDCFHVFVTGVISTASSSSTFGLWAGAALLWSRQERFPVSKRKSVSPATLLFFFSNHLPTFYPEMKQKLVMSHVCFLFSWLSHESGALGSFLGHRGTSCPGFMWVAEADVQDPGMPFLAVISSPPADSCHWATTRFAQRAREIKKLQSVFFSWADWS